MKRIADILVQQGQPKVDPSTIHKHLQKGNVDCNFPIYSIKKDGRTENTRNDGRVKEERKNFISNYLKFIWNGLPALFVGEIGFKLICYRRKSWSEKGKKAPLRSKYRRIKIFTSISAVTHAQVINTEIFDGSINSSIFETWMDGLLNKLKQNYLIVMEDSIVHDRKLIQKCEEKGHILLFNPPFSSEMNPIEHIFNLWETEVQKMEETTDQLLVEKLIQAFFQIPSSSLKENVSYVTSNVFTKAQNGENLFVKEVPSDCNNTEKE